MTIKEKVMSIKNLLHSPSNGQGDNQMLRTSFLLNPKMTVSNKKINFKKKALEAFLKVTKTEDKAPMTFVSFST